LEASVNAEDSLQQQVEAQQRQVDDANTHCEALQKARQEAEEELQVGVFSCNVVKGKPPQKTNIVTKHWNVRHELQQETMCC
jgi:topoisomerase IA-like protein